MAASMVQATSEAVDRACGAWRETVCQPKCDYTPLFLYHTIPYCALLCSTLLNSTLIYHASGLILDRMAPCDGGARGRCEGQGLNRKVKVVVSENREGNGWLGGSWPTFKVLEAVREPLRTREFSTHAGYPGCIPRNAIAQLLRQHIESIELGLSRAEFAYRGNGCTWSPRSRQKADRKSWHCFRLACRAPGSIEASAFTTLCPTSKVHQKKDFIRKLWVWVCGPLV